MDDKVSAGPLSAGSPRNAAAAPDIIDAEYETVTPGAEPGEDRRVLPREAIPPAAGLDMLRHGQQAGGSRRGQRGGPLFWIFGTALVAAAFWFSGGHALLHRPQAGPDEPASSLRIASVQSRIETHSDRALLFIDGEAVNETDASRTLPTLSINVLDNEGRTTRYLLGTNERQLAPGQHFNFSSRLIAPNGGVKSVSVTFEDQEK